MGSVRRRDDRRDQRRRKSERPVGRRRDRFEPAALDVDPGEAALGTQPQFARAVLHDREDLVESCSAGVLPAMPVGDECVRPRVLAEHPAADGRHPQSPQMILIQVVDVRVREFSREAPDRDPFEAVAFGDHAVQSDLRSDPQRPFAVVEQGVDAVVAERRRVGRVVAVMFEGRGRAVEAIESTAVGSEPQVAVAVLVDRPHDVVGKRLGVGGLVLEPDGRVAVVHHETFAGSDPHESALILVDRRDAVEVEIARVPDRTETRGLRPHDRGRGRPGRDRGDRERVRRERPGVPSPSVEHRAHPRSALRHHATRRPARYETAGRDCRAREGHRGERSWGAIASRRPHRGHAAETIPPTGHCWRHSGPPRRPRHSSHRVESISCLPSPWTTAPVGHSYSHDAQSMHSSVIVIAMGALHPSRSHRIRRIGRQRRRQHGPTDSI